MGIKAWHLFHDFDYPHTATPRIEAILKAVKKLEMTREPSAKKDPVLVWHLFNLVGTLADGILESQVAYTVALVAFWGMAWLGELVKSSSVVDQVWVKDLIWDPDGNYLKIRIREAKTAAVGEVQEIHCQYQPNLLDPVGAVRRLISDTGATDDDPVFSYPCGDRRVTWTFLRVGGALLRWNKLYIREYSEGDEAKPVRCKRKARS